MIDSVVINREAIEREPTPLTDRIALNPEGYWGSDMREHARLTEQRLRVVVRLLEPFAQEAFCKELGGNVQGENSIVFGRQGRVLFIRDFRNARAFLALMETDNVPKG